MDIAAHRGKNEVECRALCCATLGCSTYTLWSTDVCYLRGQGSNKPIYRKPSPGVPSGVIHGRQFRRAEAP